MSTENEAKADPLQRFAALRELGAKPKHAIPFVQQLAVTECGAASLAMVLGFHGRSVPLAEMREATGVDANGTNAFSIISAARRYGLRGRGIKLELKDLQYLPPASILHWDFKHYVVFERATDSGADIIDPAFGRRRVGMEELRKAFTGIALVFEPTEAFTPAAAGKSPLLRYVREVLGHKGMWARIITTSVMLQVLMLGVPLLTGSIVDKVVPRDDRSLLLVLGLGLLAMVCFFFVAFMVRAHLLLHFRAQVDARMTMGFLDHLARLPFAFFQLRSAGDLMMRLNSNATVREILTSGALSGLLDGSLVFLCLAVLLLMSFKLGLLALLFAAAQVTVFALARGRQRDLMAKNLQVEARSQSYQVELFTGIKTLKAMGVEHRAVEHWSNLFADVLNVSVERGRLNARVDALAVTLRLAAPITLLCYGATEVLAGAMTLGTMLALNALAASFLGPVSGLVSTARQLQLLGVYVERINDVLETPPEQEAGRVRPAPRLDGDVVLEGVSFRYGPQAPLAVKEVSLRVPKGRLVAVVGRSGAGKSTLANLLLGMFLPTSGRVRFDGDDIAELDLPSVRSQLGIVLQEPELFGGSIRANIALHDPTVSLDTVIEAAKLAQVHDDIAAMPLGYDTLLVDRGTSLSGGQRQRIALARALVRRPAVLLLDEATSALDGVTEREVQQALARLQCTRIVIAHRLSTVAGADLIVVMKEGCIVETGRHNELLALDGEYAKLAESQLGVGGKKCAR